MSLNTNPFTDKTFGIDPKVFTPLLKEDLTQSTPPFTVNNPLKDNNFVDLDSNGENPYLITVNEILRNLQAGFLNPDRTLSHQQWLCSLSQILSAALQGLSKFEPRDDFPSTISNLDPDEETAVKDLGRAFEAFHKFITETLTAGTFKGQQCSCCLQVTRQVVTTQHLTAILQTCKGILQWQGP
jgi:hypothetical protein